MTDPYKVLGVSPSSSDDEIKKAYRKLAKKYHPDNFSDSPLREQAEEKMKEINEAYDRIQKIRSGKESDSERYSSDYGSNYGSSTGIYYNVRVAINQGRYSYAESLLATVDEAKRSAEWYFLHGCLLYRRGWYYEAENELRRACELEPSNTEYRAAYENMKMRADNTRGAYNTSRNASSFGICDLCTAMMCADCLFGCCCGR